MTPLNVRSNNPGNLRPIGAGGFQSFASPQEGLQAMYNDLLGKVTGKSQAMAGQQPTLANIINTWAPPTENDTNGYLNFVSQQTGFSPDRVLTPDDVNTLMPAMIQMEGGKPAVDYYSGGGSQTTTSADMSPASQEVELPDGTIAEFPANMSAQDIEAVLQKQFPSEKTETPAQESSEPVQEADELSPIEKAKQGQQQAADLYLSGQQSLPSTILQGAATGADAINEYAGKALSAITLDFIGEPLQKGFQNAVSAISNTGPVRSAINKYQDFSQNHPEAARDIGALLRIGSVIAPFKVAGTGGNTALKTVGNTMVKSGEETANAAKSKFVQDLVTPKETAKVRADQFIHSTEEGLLKSRVVQPTKQEKAVIDTVAALPVKKGNSLLKNYQIISKANSDEAQNLANHLAKHDVSIDQNSVLDALSGVKTRLADSPYITGDGANAANKVLDGALEVVSNNPSTASGLLQARKDFDSWVRNYKGSKAFNPTLDSPITDAVQQTRQAINDLIEKAVPGTKDSLRTQSNLYRAMDAIETKGGDEGKNAVSRVVQKVTSGIPGKTVAAKAAVGTGLGAVGLGGLAISPPVVGGALAAYGLTKGLTSPTLRIGLGKVLRGAGSPVFKENSALKELAETK